MQPMRPQTKETNRKRLYDSQKVQLTWHRAIAGADVCTTNKQPPVIEKGTRFGNRETRSTGLDFNGFDPLSPNRRPMQLAPEDQLDAGALEGLWSTLKYNTGSTGGLWSGHIDNRSVSNPYVPAMFDDLCAL